MNDDTDEIVDLIRRGRKLDAIKRLREKTGLGLKEAKEEVERLASEMAGQGQSETAGLPGSDGGSGGLSRDVIDLAQRGEKIKAIKLLREQTGMGLKEAKETIEREFPGIQRGSGCLVVLALWVMVLVQLVAAMN